MIIKKLNVFILGLMLCNNSFAQDSTKANESLVFGGFIDTYFTYNNNNPTNKDVPYAYNHSRSNELNVNLALIKANYIHDNIRANVGLQAGTYTQYNYAAEPTILQHIYDANAGFKLTKNIWLDAGIFGSSHIGFESAISKDNWTLTRSLCAENTPYYASGAELNYEPSSKLLVSVLVCNGWQNIKDNNKNKAIGYQITYKPTEKIGFNTSSFFGEGRNLPDSIGVMRYLNHAYAYYAFSPKCSTVVMIDYGMEQDFANTSKWLSWMNPTFLLRYEFTSKWATCLRGEYYNDANKIIFSTITGNAFKTIGTSLNIDYKPYSNVMLRTEAKYFSSEKDVYERNNKPTNTSLLLTTSLAVSF